MNAARERADICVEKADQLTDQIRMVKSNDDPDLSIEESSLIASQKTKERKDHIKEMEDALNEKLARETRYMLHLQADALEFSRLFTNLTISVLENWQAKSTK